MTVRVPTSCPIPAAADMKVAKPASTTRVALPIQGAINHVQGYLLGGLRHMVTGASGVTTRAHMMTYRHPNCDGLVVKVGQSETTSQASDLTAQVGGGVPVTVTDPLLGERSVRDTLLPLFSTGDSGWTTMIVSTANRTIGSLGIWDLPRETLTTGDDRIEHEDATNAQVSLAVWDAIGASATAGPKGMIQETIDAWDNCHPQMVSWWADTELSVDSGSWTDPFGGQVFTARARQKKSEATNLAIFYVRAWCEAATSTTYSWRVTGTNTVTNTGLTNTTEAWLEPVKGVTVDATADDTLTLEFQRTAGTGKIYVIAWSGGEQ